MEKGKQKCEKLKSIRKAFAEANGVDYTPSECSSTEECCGICPKCEAEAEYIMSKVKERNSATTIIPVCTEDLSETIGFEDKNNITEQSVVEDVICAEVDMGNMTLEDFELIDPGSDLMGDLVPPFLAEDDITMAEDDITSCIDVDNGDSVDVNDNYQDIKEFDDIYGKDGNNKDDKDNK